MSEEIEEMKVKPWLNWDHGSVLNLIPVTYHERINDMIASETFGYKGLKAHLYHASRHNALTQNHLTKAIRVLNQERQAVDIGSATRNKNRNYLATLTDSVLEQYCEKYDVSYSSFMSQNDRQGLIDAIVDEMLL